MRRLTILLLVLSLGVVGPTGVWAQDDEPAAKKDDGPRKPLPWEIPRDGEDGCRPEEMVLLRQLRERATALDAREAALDQRAAVAATAEAEIAEELARVEAIRTEVLNLVNRAEIASKENVGSLARMVDAMKAKEAAPMLAGMNEDVALEILQKLKPKQAAKILGAMEPKKAQTLGDRFTLVPDPRVTLSGGIATGGD